MDSNVTDWVGSGAIAVHTNSEAKAVSRNAGLSTCDTRTHHNAPNATP
jgi:hypothetical protein